MVGVTSLSTSAISNYRFNNDLNDIGSAQSSSSLRGGASFNDADKKEGTHSIAFDGNGDYVDLDVSNQ
ncbi:MAG: hypothetical protein AAFX57_07800 [Bacteroidota bacterium]